MEKKLSKSEQNRIASQFGRMGGVAISKKRGKKYMSQLGKKGAKVRWNSSK